MRTLLLVCISSFFISANDLKEVKKEEFQIKRDKAKLESELARDNWISPIYITGQRTKDNLNDLDEEITTSTSISHSQDIFRSGGIGYQIEQAILKNDIDQSAIDYEIQELQINLYQFVLEINTLELKIEQVELSIKNKTIEIIGEQDKYDGGLVDIAGLNRVLLEKFDLENEKENLYLNKSTKEKEIKVLSDTNYKKIKIPNFKIPSLKDFLIFNKLNRQKKVIKFNQLKEKIIRTSFMPKVSLDSEYNYASNLYTRDIRKDKNSFKMGLTISLPIDYNYRIKNQIARKDYLISINQYLTQEEEEILFYNKIIDQIIFIKRKILNSIKAINRYDSLIKRVDDLYKNGLKTEYDLLILENTREEKKKTITIYSNDFKFLILELYKHGNLSLDNTYNELKVVSQSSIASKYPNQIQPY